MIQKINALTIKLYFRYVWYTTTNIKWNIIGSYSLLHRLYYSILKIKLLSEYVNMK